MLNAHAILDPAFIVGKVDARLFGSFVEHMGRCVYTGIYEPGHATATPEGYRDDVLALTREMGVRIVRYPGGNFVSGYRWEDGVGPVRARPTRIDLAWQSIESNEFGLNEFVGWTRAARVEPMVAVNLGTRGVQEAVDLVEYANHPSGTSLSDLRRQHGYPEPHDIQLWCLGNELDSPRRIGRKTAAEYGRLAADTAKAMRCVDPRIELVACGSSKRGMPTFGEWERVVLKHAYDHIDYLSLHALYEEPADDLDSFLASAVEMDAFIEEIVATCDHVKATNRSSKRIKLSFDEWNVWSHPGSAGPSSVSSETPRRLIERDYSVIDAVVVGSHLVTLMQHADRVSVACQAQLANVIAPIRTEPGGPAWRQTIFWPFAQAAGLAKGQVLQLAAKLPRYDTRAYGSVDLVTLTATHDEESGDVALFVVNRSTAEQVLLDIDIRGLQGLSIAEHTVLYDADPRATNTLADPDRVRPRPGAGARMERDRLSCVLPPLSWNVLRLTDRAHPR